MVRRAHCLWFAAFAVAALSSPVAYATDEDVWRKDAKESARHVQSGFACPKELLTSEKPPPNDLPTIFLQTVVVATDGPTRGDHVACEYEGREGSWATVEIARRTGPGDTLESRRDATRERIKRRFPKILRDAEIPGLPPTITSPTGGNTYITAYYNAQVEDRPGVVTIAGGDVGGWIVTLIQFDHGNNAIGLKLFAAMNWQRIANSRTK